MKGRLSVRLAIGISVVVAGAGAGWGDASLARSSPALTGAAWGRTVSLDDAVSQVLRCRESAARGGEKCAGVVYFWSPDMPLSQRGVDEMRRATGQLGVDLEVVEASDFEPHVEALGSSGGGQDAPSPAARAPARDLVAEMIAAGATLHYPSLLVHESGRIVGTAILGYKTAAAYQALVEDRLLRKDVPRRQRLPAIRRSPGDSIVSSRDFPVPGRPGAYFRSVPGRQTLAFESGSTIHLLDLTDGSMAVAPGEIDFVPTPDGRLFVTPDPGFPGGLTFFDAEDVFRASELGRGDTVEPIYVDRGLRDQYPSVGILRRESGRTVYRVLTSWFDGIAYRDYEVRTDGSDRRPEVRPLGDRVTACPQVSIPILSPDGQELAGRDETSATTKIFRLGEGGACQEVEDLRMQTGKVAWTPDARRIAFAIPRGAVRDGSGALWVAPDQPALAGIFVYDRDAGRATLVEGSEEVDRLAFPDFVGPDSLVFLLSPQARGRERAFRLVCCID